MKRVLTILAILLLPLSVWAMTPVSDSELSNVTGQAGVNINVDLTMDISIGTIAWGDDDGISTTQYGGYASTGDFAGQWAPSTSGGFVGVENFNLIGMTIKARTGDTFDDYDSTNEMLKPLTIDVATGGSTGHGAGVTYVRIGLGALEIKIGSLDLTVGLADKATWDDDAPDLDQVLGTFYIDNMAVYIDPSSYVDIFSHGDCGVTMSMAIELDEVSFTALSWGDTDGLGSATTPWIGSATTVSNAGYIGMNDVNFGKITITGDVLIDIARISTSGLYGGHYAGNAVVHISFANDFDVNVGGPITANIALASDNALSSNVGILGDIYLSGLNIGFRDGSWVDIWAH